MSEWAPLDAGARDEVILVTGISGSGKSVALHALEDAGYFCVDNLPPELLRDFIRLEHNRFTHRVAVAVDVRTAGSLPTLIFDEIDSGVGGAVADAVGRLMKQLGRHVQVLAVTHLAQVAACADWHLVVSKTSRDGATFSEVQPVAGEARVAEIARMLGGESLSGTAHAQAMLARGAEPETSA